MTGEKNPDLTPQKDRMTVMNATTQHFFERLL